LANNTTLPGNVMLEGGVLHCTVPGAGGVVQPTFKVYHIRYHDS